MAEEIEGHLETWAQLMVEQIRENLVSKDAWFDRSNLAQSIVALPVEQRDGGYVLTIQMAGYAEYVDQGRGKSERGLISPVESIEDWISRRGIATPLVVKITRNGKSFNRKYKNTLESRRSIAFAIANKHKDHGFVSKGLGFYSEIIDGSALLDLSEQLADKFGDKFIAEIAE